MACQAQQPSAQDSSLQHGAVSLHHVGIHPSRTICALVWAHLSSDVFFLRGIMP